MKRFLTSLLCAVLLLGFLPVLSPSAKMLTGADFQPDKNACYVGETIKWEIYNITGGSGLYSYTFDIWKDGVEISKDVIARALSFREYIPTAPGTYTAYGRVVDASDGDYLQGFANGVVIVSNVPNTVISKVEAISGTSLKISWYKLQGADGYEVWQSTSKTGTYVPVKSTAACSYIKTGLKPGTRYFYKIRAYALVDGTKYPSDSFSTVQAGVPLAKPAITSAVGVSRTQVKLTWAKVTGATGYQVFRSATAGGTYKLIKTTAALSFTAGGMLHAKTYYFKVKPYKEISSYFYYGPLSGYKAGRTK